MPANEVLNSAMLRTSPVAVIVPRAPVDVGDTVIVEAPVMRAMTQLDPTLVPVSAIPTARPVNELTAVQFVVDVPVAVNVVTALKHASDDIKSDLKLEHIAVVGSDRDRDDVTDIKSLLKLVHIAVVMPAMD